MYMYNYLYMYEYVYGCVAKIAEHSPYFCLRWYVTSTNPLTVWLKTRIITKLKETPPLESTYNSISHFFFSSLLSIFIVTFYLFFFFDFWVWLAHFLLSLSVPLPIPYFWHSIFLPNRLSRASTASAEQRLVAAVLCLASKQDTTSIFL